MKPCTNWIGQAIKLIQQDFQRSSDTHLFKIVAPAFEGIDFYIKDESTHPTGNLKHRLARSLFLFGLCNGKIGEGTTIIEASSGNTAISEAYFARMLGLPFVAVIPKCTSQEKISQIAFYGGRCHFVQEAGAVYAEAEKLAREVNGHYMDQFTYAEQATDWRGNNNIAESIFEQMSLERYPDPSWIVVGAGTGGTSATLGRYIRYQCKRSRLCVADPEHSVFFDFFHEGDKQMKGCASSRIEGIGRPRVEPSFIPGVIDRMLQIKDAKSVACMQLLSELLGKKCGPSSGTNFAAVLELAHEMRSNDQVGSIVTLVCDSGDRYLKTFYDDRWLDNQFGNDVAVFKKQIDRQWSSIMV